MRIFSVLFILSICLGFSTACVQSPTGPGLIYMNVKGPLGAASATESPRTGKSCARVFLALFAWGDASIDSAKKDAGITQVATVDHESFNFIGFGSFCTVVHGS